MDTIGYVQLKQVAERWNISVRRVQTLCSDGRIKGAVRAGRDWMIPENAERPSDARTKAGRQDQAVNSTADMPMPLKTPFLHMTNLYNTPGCAENAVSELSYNPEAQTLFAAEIAYSRGQVDKV